MSIINSLKRFIHLKAIDSIEKDRKKLPSTIFKMAPPAKPLKEWSVLFYQSDINKMPELVKAGSNDDVNIAAQIAVADSFKGEAERFYVEKEPKECPRENIGKVDMGDPKTLEDFILWGIKNYPAEKFMLVLAGHGGGFEGSMYYGEANNHISNENLKKTLENVYRKTGVKVDILAFDACVMAQSEVAYELKDNAKILIGSEETMAEPTISYVPILKELQEDTKGKRELSIEELAKLYINKIKIQQADNDFYVRKAIKTQSAIDLSKIDEIKNACDKLAKALIVSKIDKDIIQEIIHKTQHYCVSSDDIKPCDDFCDLYNFAENISEDPNMNDPEVIEAAQEVMDSVKNTVIAEEHQGADVFKVDNSHGISIYLPANYGYDKVPADNQSPNFSKTHHYEDTSWAKDTAWDEMLVKYSKDEKKINAPAKKLPANKS